MDSGLTGINLDNISFSDLIGLTSEPNTPSGGHATIDAILKLAHIPPFGQVLEIGCATGFTCLEIAACRPDLRVEGIDINPQSISAAHQAAADAGIINARFSVGDASALRFADRTYDLVSCGNVPAFVDDRSTMIRECARVTRAHGVIVAVPIYYRQPPPDDVRQRVERAIGAHIEIWDEAYWRSLYESEGLVLREVQHHSFRDVPMEEMYQYAERVMATPQNHQYLESTRRQLIDLLASHYKLFNENNRYTGYSVMVFRKSAVNKASILFTPDD